MKIEEQYNLSASYQPEQLEKFEQIKLKLFEYPNVIGVGLSSKPNEPLIICVLLSEPDLNFPIEIDGVKLKSRVTEF